MSSTVITGLMKDAILQLCQENLAYRGRIEVDGIICITGQDEGEQIVVKVHEQLSQGESGVGTDSPSPMRSLLANYEANHIRQKHNSQGINHRENSPERNYVDDHLLEDVKEEATSPPKRIRLDPEYSKSHEDNRPSTQLMQKYQDNLSSDSTANSKAYPSMLNALKKPIVIRPTTIHSRLEKIAPAAAGLTPECKTCCITYNTFEALQEHNDLRHNACTCHHCYRTFTSRSNLERHLRLHTGQKPYVCMTCGKAFSRKDHLGNHVAKHAFKCGTCLKRFSDREGLSIHYEQDHDQKLHDICFQCNKGFCDANIFLEHKKLHPTSAPENNNHKDSSKSFRISPAKISLVKEEAITIHTCEICHFSCTEKLMLQKHNLSHGEMQCNYTCISCLQRFVDPIQYETHLEIEHPNENYIYECVFCRRINKTFNELKRHESVHLHSQKESYSCPQCAVVYHSKGGLTDHMKSHTTPAPITSSPTNAKFKCSSCEAYFVKLSELRQHQQEQGHTGWKVRVPNAGTQPPIITPDKLSPADGDESEEAMGLSPIPPPAQEFEEDEDEILVIQPEAPEDSLAREDEDYSRDFVITDNPAPVIEVLNEDVKAASSNISNADSDREDDDDADVESSQGSPSDTSSTSKAKSNGDGSNRTNSRYVPPEIDGPFTCSHCKNEHATLMEFEAHVYQNHYRYPCMYCPKTFGQKANRDRHTCIHTGVKPFSCPECNEAFSRGDKLKHHRAKAHGKSLSLKKDDTHSWSGSDVADVSLNNNGEDLST